MDSIRRGVVNGLVGVFFLSGFSALLYQVVWQRMLGLFSGSDVRSVTIVTSAYLAGLGVGSLLGTTYADRLTSRRAVHIYGLCNLGIAAFAVFSRFLYYDLLFLELNTLARSPLVLLVIVFISLLFPTALMGVSLPLLSKAVVRTVDNAARLITWLYGVNTLGAGVGTVISGWILIGSFGYEGAVYLGAGLSALVGLTALTLARQFPDDDKTKASVDLYFHIRRVPHTIWMWCFLVFASGFIVISLEILWFRILDVTLHSNAYTFAHLLFFFLVGDALGSLVGARFVHRVQNPRRVFLWIQGLVALYAVCSIWFVMIEPSLDPLREYVGTTGAQIELVIEDNLLTWFVYLIIPSVIMLPPSFLIGFYFPIVQKAVQTDAHLVGQRVGLVDVANILGNSLGGIVTGTVLLHFLGTADSLRLIALLGLIFVLVLMAENFKLTQRRTFYASGFLSVGLLAAVIGFPSGTKLWANLHDADELFIVSEDSTGVAALQEIENGIGIYANGTFQGGIPIGQVHSFLGSLPALVHPDPQNVLVIGIGSTGTPYSVGVNPEIERIVSVEIIGSEIDVLEKYNQDTESVLITTLLTDPRYEIVIGDGRRELALSDTEFDIIEADAILPYASHSGLLYSREFFEMARSKLREGGIMSQWRATQRVENTFVSVFPYVVNVGNTILLGSNEPIPFDSAALVEKIQSPEVQAYLAAAGVDAESLIPWLEAEPQRWTPDMPRDKSDINTDLFPKDEYYLNNPNE
ncbi:MAG: spermidine synthase [Anaerolineae bacterium]|nr:spermidine synthase [Anaerolineae bacterium]